MKTSLLLLPVLLCCACGGKEPAADAGAADPQFVGEARAATNKMQIELKQALSAAMQEGGPVQALDVCNERAPEIAMQMAAATGLSVRRVSERRRNLANVPTEGQRAVLQYFQAHPTAEDTVIVDAGTPTYLRPIRITTDLCLQCHGATEDLGAGVQTRLDALYPEDRATGFAMGDLRGAFVVQRDQAGSE